MSRAFGATLPLHASASIAAQTLIRRRGRAGRRFMPHAMRAAPTLRGCACSTARQLMSLCTMAPHRSTWQHRWATSMRRSCALNAERTSTWRRKTARRRTTPPRAWSWRPGWRAFANRADGRIIFPNRVTSWWFYGSWSREGGRGGSVQIRARSSCLTFSSPATDRGCERRDTSRACPTTSSRSSPATPGTAVCRPRRRSSPPRRRSPPPLKPWRPRRPMSRSRGADESGPALGISTC
mmetsp:Transcript_6402/g.20163  ORF Transcript_6402/g.20163 Transcript_6402/m.20163 type:complete len:238 (-) Transcript_6402:20-733(-)